MPGMKSKTPFALGLVLALAAACAPPVRDLDTEEIGELTDLEELMYVKATIADPRFKLARSLEGETPSDADWAAFADMGARLQVTSRHGKRFSMGPGFDAYLDELEQQAAALETAAEARDAGATLRLALEIKGTCRACHDDYR